MNVFSHYARYYDLLYQDKDYQGETEFIHQLIQTYASDSQDILELGCGTGNHAVLLATKGYQVHGVDLSEEMLQKANSRLLQLHPNLISRLQFTQGDIRYIRLNQRFNVIISLFHVISYQTTNDDLIAAFATVKEHLQPGGIFIFDIWYGPAVLTEVPKTRVKRLSDDKIIVTRIAEPVMYPNENLVDVNYQVFIRDKSSNTVEELEETHRMRYIFKPEIELILQKFQMQLVTYREWMSDRHPACDTWSVYFIGKI